VPDIVKDRETVARAKDETVLLGRIQRYVESAYVPDEGRDTKVIHPSELSRTDFCPRASWHKLSGHPVVERPAPMPFALLTIFDEGSAVHNKWQLWLWNMGELIGEFRCRACKHVWWDKAPKQCPECGRGRRLLEYMEVPAEDPDLLIAGRADSRVGNSLQEYKTVGEGTVRIEHPALYAEHSYLLPHPKWGNEFLWVDLRGLWRGIVMPFPGHLRQIQLYLYLTGLDSAQIIYECKWNQQNKEFAVRFRPALVEPLLDMAADIAWALKTGSEVECRHGGPVECARCRVYEGSADAEVPGCQSAAGSGDARRQSRAREGGVLPSRPAGAADPQAAVELDRAHGRRSDAAVCSAGEVARPHRRVARAPGDR
jgi:hypothetical protein